MNDLTQPLPLAKLQWKNPETGEDETFFLHEGIQITIGRSATNPICIAQQHVSREHASIEYRDGMFVLSDLGSANGTFINDQLISGPTPLLAGDKIRLYTPEIDFLAVMSPDEVTQNRIPAAEEGELPHTAALEAARLIFMSGPQKDETVDLTLEDLKIGRATQNHNWEIGIQDGSVSRPHARLARINGHWFVYDLGSANGTRVNNVLVTEKGKILSDGDVLTVGQTFLQFRSM